MKRLSSLHLPLLRDLKVIPDLPTKIFITITVVVSFLVLPKVGYLSLEHEELDITRNILFPLSHANVFHLICNILCLWQIRSVRHWIIPAIIVSFLASFLPTTNAEPVMGFSGILFAILGIQYGFYNKGSQMIRNTWLFFFVTAFIPNVAVLFHIYCMSIAFAYGWLWGSYNIWKKVSCI